MARASECLPPLHGNWKKQAELYVPPKMSSLEKIPGPIEAPVGIAMTEPLNTQQIARAEPLVAQQLDKKSMLTHVRSGRCHNKLSSEDTFLSGTVTPTKGCDCRIPGCCHQGVLQVFAASAKEWPRQYCFLSFGLKGIMTIAGACCTWTHSAQVMSELNLTLPVLSTAITSLPMATACFPIMR